MALSVVPNRYDNEDDDELLDTTKALPTMGQLIRETSLLLPGLKPGQKTIDNTIVRVSEESHARDIHAISGPAHHVETRVVTAQFKRVGKGVVFTLLGEYGNEMQPVIWKISYPSGNSKHFFTLYDFQNPGASQDDISTLQVQRFQKLLETYRKKMD